MVCHYAILVSQNTSISKNEWAVWFDVVMAEYLKALSSSPECKSAINLVEMNYDEYYAGLEKGISSYKKIYENSNEHVDYFEDLVNVAKAGFLAEYIWSFHSNSSWGNTPEMVRIDEFEAWKKKNIPNHVVRQEVGLGTALKPAGQEAIDVIPDLKKLSSP